MKLKYFTLLLLLSSTILSGQADSSKTKVLHHEIGFIALSYYYLPSYSYGKGPVVGYSPSGISYKFIIKNVHAIRAGFEYYTNQINYRTFQNKTEHSTSGPEITKQGRLGYERIFRQQTRLRPYLLADIIYQETNTAIGRLDNTIWPGPQTNTYSRYDSTIYVVQRINSYQCLFGGGIKFFADKHVFCSFEASLGISYYSETKQSQSWASFSNGINGPGSSFYYHKYPIENESSKGFLFSGNFFRFSFAILI